MHDDRVLPFQVEGLDVRGRLARLGPALTAIIDRHGYPAPVARVLAEAVTLCVLLATSLKLEGRLILQAQTEGVVRMVVADFTSPDGLRALARFDEERLQEAIASGQADPARLLGKGTLAFTIDQGGAAQRYQGIVALDGEGLEQAADRYFAQSEQIPTRVKLAVAEQLLDHQRHEWRAGGLMVQFLPTSPERMRQADLHPGDAPQPVAPSHTEDDAWLEARVLAETVEAVELVDPALSSEELLFRLFHERGVRVFEPMRVADRCTCSRERLGKLVASFSDDDRTHMIVDGAITVTCEYCSTQYRFAPNEVRPDGAPL